MQGRFSDPVFEDVREGSLESFACSPHADDPAFRGIVLAAPESVGFTPGDVDPITGAFAPVIVCGTYVFDYETEGLDGDFVESIVLVAVDETRRETFRGTMATVENALGGPSVFDDGGLEPQDFAGDVITGYFNPNLATVLGLPERPADYVVYALLGPYESNRVKIQVREADGDTQ